MEEKYETVYRAVVELGGVYWEWDEDNKTNIRREGRHLVYSRPYSTVGPAKAAATRMRRNNSHSFVSARVEKSIGWEPLDGDGQNW